MTAGHQLQEWLCVSKVPDSSGRIEIFEVHGKDGLMADAIDAFVDQFADLIIGYAIADNPDLDAVLNVRYRFPGTDTSSLNRAALDRLISPADNYNALKGFAGECLCHWFYSSHISPVASTAPKPFSADPAFDLIALRDVCGQLRTTCVQAKATSGNATTLAGRAVAKYRRLQAGEFDMELANELRSLARIAAVRDRIGTLHWREALMTSDLRDHAIVIAYDGPPPFGAAKSWPQRWFETIAGPPTRRALVTFPLLDCNRFVQHLAQQILHAAAR